jgi:membrane-associated phospholipid phosphatase
LIFCFFFLKVGFVLSQEKGTQFFTIKRYQKINWNVDTVTYNKSKLWKKSIIPVGVAALSLSMNSISTKTNIQQTILDNTNYQANNIDSYLKYAPIGLMYSADLLKIKAKNSIWRQTKYLFLSELFSACVTLGLKHLLNIQRPNEEDYNSFPSGHSSVAFTASQVLYNEFHEHNKMIAYSGFLFSIPTATMRVLSNEHWVPDVLMGMSIGILMTNLVYHFEPLKNWNPWKKEKNIVVLPTVNSTYSGLYFSYKI